MSEGWLRLHHGQPEEWNDLHRSDERSRQTRLRASRGADWWLTRRYGCKLLVWFEAYDDLQEARRRELQMKEWKRAWKIRLIEKTNLDWDDLYSKLF